MSASNIVCRNVTDNSSSESRHSLISWVNELADLNLQKVEELNSGVAYCRLIYTIFPSCISVKRIKTDAKFEYEFQTNFKLLQTALETIGCNKVVPINKLVKGKFQENFEFLQWFKKFFEANRELSEVCFRDSPKPAKVASDVKPKFSSRPVQIVRPIIPQAPVPRISRISVETLEKQMTEINEKGYKLLVERDFYFRKLKAIDVLCSKKLENEKDSEGNVPDPANLLVSKILKKVHEATYGFVTP